MLATVDTRCRQSDVALLGQSGLCNRLGRRLQKCGLERLSDHPSCFGVYLIEQRFIRAAVNLSINGSGCSTQPNDGYCDDGTRILRAAAECQNRLRST